VHSLVDLRFLIAILVSLEGTCGLSRAQAQTPVDNPFEPFVASPPMLDQSDIGQQSLDASNPKTQGMMLPSANTVDLASPQVISWLSNLIRDNLPPAYDDDRKWGHQREVWDGVDLRREGLKLETKRKKKLVNSGTWTKYHVEFVEPAKNVHIEFQRLESTPDGRIAFSVSVACLLDVFGRMSQWVRDVQMVSISANADAVCKLTMSGSVQFHLNPLKLPPDVIIKPHVETAFVELSYFRMRRVSQIGGDFAKALGEGAKGVIEDKIEDTNRKLVDKINQQIDKQQSKMVFSMQDWLQSKLPMPNSN
jgi:hypothetical protein